MKRIVAFALAGVFTFSQFSFASRQFLQNMVIEYDAPTSVKGQEMTTIGGGGVRIRWQDANAALFNVQAPSLKMGCSGIDASLGSLGLLNFEEFGKLFQALMGPAGVMFVAQLALSTLCPQCEEVLSKLMSIANQLNQFQLNQCNAVALAGAVGKQLGSYLNKQLTGGSGQSAQQPAWAKAVKNTLSSFSNFLDSIDRSLREWCPNGRCGLRLMLNGGCIMSVASQDLSNVATLLGTNSEGLAAVLRAYFGDLCFPGAQAVASRGNESLPEGHLVEGVFHPSDFVSMIAGFSDEKCEGRISMAGKGARVSASGVNTYTVSITLSNTLCGAAKQLVENVIRKVRTRQPLSDEERQLLASAPVSVFKLINYGSVYPGFLESIEGALAKYIAVEAAVAVLEKISTTTADVLTAYQAGTTGQGEEETKTSKDITKLMDNVRAAGRDLAEIRARALKELQDSIKAYDTATNIYNDMLARMAHSPIYGNMVVSRLFGVR